MSHLAFFGHANVFQNGGQPIPIELSIAVIPTDGNKNGRGNLVGKAMNSWPTCHEFESSTAEDPQCRWAMHEKSIDAKTFSCRFNILKDNEGRRKQHSRKFIARREPRVLTLVQT
ncbi:hypothetical protein TNCV_813491 [Trichonephila clavipes]|nr:hypothetical protein TNCV_813491 [Trichonephila clavipes]